MAVTKNDLPEKYQMVKNILNVYDDATPEDIYEGMSWYNRANWIAQGFADITPYTIEQVAAVMAIVSPGMVWDENESAPGRILDLHWNGVPASDWAGFSTYPANLEKAERVLDEEMDAVSGNKVSRFYANILGNSNVVTVDRWAVRIALSNPWLGKDKIVPSGITVYSMIENAYVAAADLAEIAPSDMQAVTWVSYRRRYLGKRRPRKDALVGQLVG